jgi:prefoldin subunit 5
MAESLNLTSVGQAADSREAVRTLNANIQTLGAAVERLDARIETLAAQVAELRSAESIGDDEAGTG